MYDLTYDPITGTGLPPTPGALTITAAIENRWVAAAATVDGRTAQVAFTGGQAARSRREAERWLIDMAPLIGLQHLEVDGRVWQYARGWRPAPQAHPDMYLELTEEAGATLLTVIEPTGDPIVWLPDPERRQPSSRRAHWRVYTDGIVLPVNGARTPRSFPTVLPTNPVVAAWTEPAGVVLVLTNGDTPMVPVTGAPPARPPVVVVNTGTPPNQSIPAPPTQGVGP